MEIWINNNRFIIDSFWNKSLTHSPSCQEEQSVKTPRECFVDECLKECRGKNKKEQVDLVAVMQCVICQTKSNKFKPTCGKIVLDFVWKHQRGQFVWVCCRGLFLVLHTDTECFNGNEYRTVLAYFHPDYLLNHVTQEYTLSSLCLLQSTFTHFHT